MSDRIKPTGILRLLRAFGYSFQGFRHAWREEAAFRQEAGLALLIIPAGLYLGRSGVERALLVSPMLIILVVEILNSAVEAVVDRAGTERHPLAGMAKDTEHNLPLGSACPALRFFCPYWCCPFPACSLPPPRSPTRRRRRPHRCK